MTRSSLSLSLFIVTLGCSWDAAETEPPFNVLDVKQVHDILSLPLPQIEDVLSKRDEEMLKEIIQARKERMKKINYLLSVGERAYPTYETILTDSNSDKHAVRGVLDLIGEDAKQSRFRNRFRQLALSRLTDKDYKMRRSALRLLGRIGGPGEAPLVAVCLYDQIDEVGRTAAEVLFQIGGPKELASMTEWLRGDSHRDFLELREHVRKCRDELKKRLDAKNDPPK